MSFKFHRDVINALEDIKVLREMVLALMARVEALEKKRKPKDAD